MLRTLFWAAIASAGVGLASSLADAAPITLDTWYTFSFQGVGSALAACTAPCAPGTDPPDGHPSVAAPAAPWTITTLTPTILRVLDGFLSVDQFNIDNLLIDPGDTSPPTPPITGCGSSISCAFINSAFSHRDFPLDPGPHSFSGTHILGASPGAGFFEVISAAAVPEPSSLALLGVAMMGASFVRRIRRRISAA